MSEKVFEKISLKYLTSILKHLKKMEKDSTKFTFPWALTTIHFLLKRKIGKSFLDDKKKKIKALTQKLLKWKRVLGIKI